MKLHIGRRKHRVLLASGEIVLIKQKIYTPLISIFSSSSRHSVRRIIRELLNYNDISCVWFEIIEQKLTNRCPLLPIRINLLIDHIVQLSSFKGLGNETSLVEISKEKQETRRKLSKISDNDLSNLVKDMDFESPTRQEGDDNDDLSCSQTTTTEGRVLITNPSIAKSAHFESIYGEAAMKSESVLTNLPTIDGKNIPPSLCVSITVPYDNAKKYKLLLWKI